jgi:hypothetical protein
MVLSILACLSLPAQAELAALVHDNANGTLRVVRVDSDDGSVTTGSVFVQDCCFVSAGMTAADTAGGGFFVYGLQIDGGGFGSPLLLEMPFDGNSASAVALAREPEGVLAFDASMGRLIAFEFGDDAQNPTLQLIAIDPQSGAVTDIGAVNTSCCEVMTGTRAIDSAGQRLFFVGRDFGASTWSIQSISLADGVVTEVGAMPASGRPGFLSLNDAGTELEIYMQDGLAGAAGLHRMDIGTGASSTISVEADGGCCLMGLGESASLDQTGTAWWMGGSGTGGSPSPGFMALPAAADISDVPAQTIAGDYRLHAVVVDGQVTNPFLLFSDRFEL